jgi:glucokinase
VDYLGLDIGGTEVKAGVVDDQGRIVQSDRRASEPNDRTRLFETIAELIKSVSANRTPRAIGVGVPGLVSQNARVVDFAPNVRSLNLAPVSDLITEITGLPTVVANDADMNAWGEFAVGAGTGTRHMACLTIGTGLGSGLIVNGRLYAGTRGYGAEAGHIVVQDDGRACGCGGRGCLETIVSATGIVAMAREGLERGVPTILRSMLENGTEGLSARMVLDAATLNDAFSMSIYTHTGRYLGIACASLINLLNLEMIIIGGGVSAAGEYLLGPAIGEAKSRTYRHTFESCQIVPAKIGSDAGIVGAALYAAKKYN